VTPPSALHFSGFGDIRLLASTSAAAVAVNDDELNPSAVAVAVAVAVEVAVEVVVVVVVKELVRLLRSSPWLLLPVLSSSVVDFALGLFAVLRLFVFRTPSSVAPHFGPDSDGDFRLPPPPALSSSELELLDDLRVHHPPSVRAQVHR
jgi:hypothetical protein